VYLYRAYSKRVWWLQWGTNSAPPNPLAGIEGPLRGGGEKGQGKKGGEKERRERDGMDEIKHPRNKFLVMALRSMGRYGHSTKRVDAQRRQ